MPNNDDDDSCKIRISSDIQIITYNSFQ